MERREFLLVARLEPQALDAWVAEGWLRPRASGEDGPFSAIDLARAQLIRDLGDLGVNDDSVPIILDLVDQLHGVRRMLRDLLVTVGAQPEATRQQILSCVRDTCSRRRDGS